MSDLSDILAHKNLPQEPPEFKIIRQFVQQYFDATPHLRLRGNAIVITVSSSALAGSLRYKLPELKSQLDSDYSLVIVSS